MSACPQELCRNWTGQGCACEVMGIEPSIDPDGGLLRRDAEQDWSPIREQTFKNMTEVRKHVAGLEP
jgi:hypothetical protein